MLYLLNVLRVGKTLETWLWNNTFSELFWMWSTQSAMGERNIRSLDLSGMFREAPRFRSALKVKWKVCRNTMSSYFNQTTFVVLFAPLRWTSGRIWSLRRWKSVEIGRRASFSKHKMIMTIQWAFNRSTTRAVQLCTETRCVMSVWLGFSYLFFRTS